MRIENKFMTVALAEAEKARALGEVPVGAVVVRNSEVISAAHNLVESTNDPAAHAEIIALKRASELLGRRQLNDCILYVTLEPCAMCTGAIILYRIGALAFGAFDKVAGCCMSNAELLSVLNYRIPFVGGILETECRVILSEFFRDRRKQKQADN